MRHVLKWIATIAFMLVAVSAVASGWLEAHARITVGSHTFTLALARGILTVNDYDTKGLRPSHMNPPKHFLRLGEPANTVGVLRAPGLQWWPRQILMAPSVPYWRWELSLPLWLLLVVLSIPTVLLWRLDRHRSLPNHCRNCNYNLTANTSGICPECGKSTSAAAH